MTAEQIKKASDWLNSSFELRWKIIGDKSKTRHQHEAETLAAYAEVYSQAENERLRDALERYGDHDIGCNRRMCWHTEHDETCCDCGFQELAAALRPEQRKDGENG